MKEHTESPFMRFIANMFIYGGVWLAIGMVFVLVFTDDRADVRCMNLGQLEYINDNWSDYDGEHAEGADPTIKDVLGMPRADLVRFLESYKAEDNQRKESTCIWRICYYFD